MTTYSRRDVIKWAGAAAAGLALLGSGCSPQAENEAATPQAQEPRADQAYLAVARGSDAAAITRAAIQALGGMQRFVKRDANVIIKPNICVAYHGPEYAATTNPIVVATLIGLCLEAGAKRVRIMDTPFGGTAESAYEVTGIGKAVRAAGGEMEIMSPIKFIKTPIPEGRDIKEWSVYKDILEADLVINVPIAKHHSLARLTLGGKNLLGVITRANEMHWNLDQRIADLASLVRPGLTVVDAVRVLMAHGPTGGSLNDVKQANTVVASHDMVATDAWATSLFGMTAEDLPYIKAASEMGLGTMDLGGLKIEEINA
jgi:uncharacterized protein (DUF362 family)